MVTLLNIIIVFFIILIPFLLFYLFRVGKKTKKSFKINFTILFGILLSFVVFYFPTRMTLPNHNQLEIIIEERSQKPVSIKNENHINELIKLVEHQKLMRSTIKTLSGTFSYPAEHGINIIISSKEQPYHLYVFARDDVKETFFLKNGQYYSVINGKNFVDDIFGVDFIANSH